MSVMPFFFPGGPGYRVARNLPYVIMHFFSLSAPYVIMHFSWLKIAVSMVFL